jgi:hypothetical protein
MSDLFAGAPDRIVGLVVNAPAVFARKDFMAWLNEDGRRVMTYHPNGLWEADEYSDVTVLVDSNYDGDCSDMPEDVWKAICDLAYAEFGGPDAPSSLGSHINVRLTNLVA